MNINGKCRVFRKDFDTRIAYTTGISNKKDDGTYDSMYVNLQLPKGTDILNNTEIDVKHGFLSNYKDKDGNYRIKLVVMSFDVLSQVKDDPIDDGVDASFISVEDMDDLPF